ncbi:MAG: TIGR00725 family protein [Actinomycetota bacterium]
MYVAVIGAGQCDQRTAQVAYEVGRLVALKGAILVCGGLGGVMNAAAQGAREAGGLTVGILPSETRTGASKFIDVAIPSGLGEARNALIARAADVVIAIGGGYGTLSEIGLALKMGKPVIGLGTWEIGHGGQRDPGIIVAGTPQTAIEKAFQLTSGI